MSHHSLPDQSYMTRIWILLICYYTTGIIEVCEGQDSHVTDSLLSVIKTTKDDSNKVKTLNALSKNYAALGELDHSKKYAEDAILLTEKIKFHKGKITSNINIGIVQYYRSNYPEAHKKFLTALQISQELGNKQGIADSQRSVAMIYDAQGNYKEALKIYTAALNIYEEIKDSAGMASCYNNMGIVYDSQGNYPEALASYFASSKINEGTGNKQPIANTYVNIGVTYLHQRSYSDALKSFLFALGLYEEIGNKRGISICYSNIGMTYMNQNNFAESKDYAFRSLTIDEELGDRVGMALAYNTIGNVSYMQENYPEALEYYFKALKLFQEIGDTINLAVTHTGLGMTYGNLDQFKEAETYMGKGLLLAKSIGAKHAMVEIYKQFTIIYENRNDFKNAYKYHKLFFEMNDSIFNEVKSQQIEELKVQYESAKKENEIAILNKDQALHLTEIKKQKILKSFFMGGLLLITLLGYVAYKYFRNAQKLKVQTLRNKIAIDLHDDVGSSLTSIRLYSEIAKKLTTDPQVSGVLDKISQNAGEVIHSMSDIVWMINPKYDAFGSVFSRMENTASELLSPLNIQYTIKKDIEVESIKFSMAERQNIFMIFKEAIHNAAKHANCQSVAIHLSRNKDHLQMNITDDGSGFDKQEILHGNGLSSMENRAAEIHGTITVAASPGRGTSVTLSMLV